jgi:hypothetical protein
MGVSSGFKSLRAYQNLNYSILVCMAALVRCEKCNQPHDGSYASGRFCSEKCSRGFSTSKNREAINQKVSATLEGHPDWVSVEARRRASAATRERWRKKIMEVDFDSLSIDGKKKRVVIEQGGKCFRCNVSEWMGEPLTLQVDHEDGDTRNNKRDNLRGLCPNCHSQTPTYCGKKRNRGNAGSGSVARVTDEMLLAALLSSKSMSEAFARVGYSRQKRHFERSKKLLREYSAGASAQSVLG